MSLISTLVGELLLFVLLWVVTASALLGLCWATGLLRWQGSALPADPTDDPRWDEKCLGWWCDDLAPPTSERAVLQRGVTYRGDTSRADLQFLLPLELVDRRHLTVLHCMDGAQY